MQYLCAGQGIEIETLGVKRDNYTLPEYKKAMEVTNELQKQANEMQKQVKKDKVIIDKYNLEAEALKKIEQVLKEDENNINGTAVPVKNFFGNEEYVKIKKNDWGHILEAYKWAKSKEKILEQYEETIIAKDNKISQLQIFKKNCISFISKLGIAERFNEFILPKSVKKELKKKQE